LFLSVNSQQGDARLKTAERKLAMERQQILAKVVELIRDNLKIGDDVVITEKTLFGQGEGGLGADSLEMADLLMAIEDDEKGFNIKVPDDAEGKIKTVGDAVDWVTKLL